MTLPQWRCALSWLGMNTQHELPMKHHIALLAALMLLTPVPGACGRE